MKLKQPLLMVFLGSTAALLSTGITACTSSFSNAPTDSSDQSSTPAIERPMAGMDHGFKTSTDSMIHSADLGPKDESFDLRFIDAMTPHHEKTVRMAQEALQKSNRPEIKQFAQTLMDEQAREIAQMQVWRVNWYPTAGNTHVMYDAKTGQTIPMPAATTTNEALGDADEQFDLRLINALIPHFEGGIEMAKQVLQNSDRPEMKQLAQAIIDSQQQELDRVEQWKQQWYGQ